MDKILYVNACVREESRTNRLARFALDKMNGDITELRLDNEALLPLDGKLLKERTHLSENGDFSHPAFKQARQFADANTIVIAAPYWDLSFPSALKVYLERINIAGIVFRYLEDGSIKSLCKAERLIYIASAGGPIFEPNMGFSYVKQVAESFFGISEFEYYKAEGLDIFGADVEGLLLEAEQKIQQSIMLK